MAEQAMVEAAHMRLKRIYPRGGPSDVGLMVAEVEHLREKLAAAGRERDQAQATARDKGAPWRNGIRVFEGTEDGKVFVQLAVDRVLPSFENPNITRVILESTGRVEEGLELAALRAECDALKVECARLRAGMEPLLEPAPGKAGAE